MLSYFSILLLFLILFIEFFDLVEAVTPDRGLRKRNDGATNNSVNETPPSKQSQGNRPANRLNDILGAVKIATNEVDNALRFRSNAGGMKNNNNGSNNNTNISSSTPAIVPSTPPPGISPSSCKSSEKRKQLAENEMFAYSSEDEDEDNEDEYEFHNKSYEKREKPSQYQSNQIPSSSEDNELEKTLDNWLLKQGENNNQDNQKKSRRVEKEDGKSRDNGGDDEINEDDGGVADLQCLLADVLMSSNEELQDDIKVQQPKNNNNNNNNNDNNQQNKNSDMKESYRRNSRDRFNIL